MRTWPACRTCRRNLMEPATPYVRGKYYYYRNRLDDAAAVFASIPQTNPYFFQARYFLAHHRGQEGRPRRRQPAATTRS